MNTAHFSPGEDIFREGDPAESAYVITSGQVAIIKEEGDQEIVLAHLGPGEIFGEMGLVDDKARSAGARALSAVEVERMTHEHFMFVLMQRPKEALGYLKVLFERLRSVNAMVTQVEERTEPAQASTLPALLQLFPDSDEAKRFIPDEGLPIERLPFRFGRAHTDPMATNDFVVVDQSPFSVSRYHFLVERSGQHFLIKDRGSYLGTIVNGEKIGGKRAKGSALLNQGENQLIVGSEGSPFRFLLKVP